MDPSRRRQTCDHALGISAHHLQGLKELKMDVVGAQEAKQGTELVDLLEGLTPRDIDKLVARLSEVQSDQLPAGSPRKQSVNTSMFSKSWLFDVF
jgi:hypothetical protein